MIIRFHRKDILVEKTVSATDMVRRFSEILNSIKYKGDSYTIVRRGKPVASIRPVQTPRKERTLGELKALLKNIPRLGSESESFDHELKKLRKDQPFMPKDNQWA